MKKPYVVLLIAMGICVLYVLLLIIFEKKENPVAPLERLEYVTTGSGYTSRLLSYPFSGEGTEILRIPENTKLKVLEGKDLNSGMTKVYWFKVEYEGMVGWISSYSTKECEELGLDPRR